MKNFIDSGCGSRSTAVAHSARVYASPADFCAIFDQDMNSLYSLALLLTASHETAQECFLDALCDCRTGSTVFPEWARSWSRRAVIKNAIRLLDPASPNSREVSKAGVEEILNSMDATAQDILKLSTSSRLVFVINVLEGYSTRECAALLGWSSHEVEQAKILALQWMANDARDLMPVPESRSHAGEIPLFALQ